MIQRQLKKLTKQHFLIIYKTYVHPHLEYCIHAYSPWLKKDIECVEKVQQRATKIVLGLHNLKYDESLSQLGLTTLTRNSSGDEIANVNFFYDDIVHVLQNTIDSCINSATNQRGGCGGTYVYQIQ